MRVIAGTARSLKLDCLPGLETRPTTDRIKETLFNMLAPEIGGCRFLDLFSGSGAIGIEALSRGAAEAVFVEKNPKAAAVIRKNLSFTRLDSKGELITGELPSALAGCKGRFDVVFMDPPYNRGLEIRILSYLRDSSLITENSLIVVEASLDTSLGGPEIEGFKVVREKRYKTNQHIFLKKKGTR